ncbi:MAG: tRNA 2-thiouridine(34) synthase MnmA [Candidatus Chisholmbacteria bacterium RIFCSPHIGHO2_01_FULL_48_12]|uniref:tRNA-specific 2-thiouridylase MnmA n=1 Tax=Candidatus Chisholmbacteria bacterium RIFCSPHIGHO2_01_FULL_48_12 TaxID=1797589 RepID=A0A1G1VMJ4_9BACT|nr:MAG: tRNA 2-thiouridine(34) synthase MnmA [Candidatus Chisholmbacteria bacterium RIFCSPHIGHO2_01_FULL_48_12]
MKKVAVGLSGGVDSAVAAALLVDQGYDVTGVFLECWKEPGCRTDTDRKDALSVALKLGIPFKVLDFKREYKQKVVDYFYAEYKAGRTPNPDVMCNKEIKFGLFYDWCLKNSFDYVVTGHYAKIVHQVDSLVLCIPKDKHKDQTYFLYRLRQEQLPHILFPLGDWTKTEVRQEAKRRGLPVADKPDSQGICFIGEVNIQEFLRERLPVKLGEVVDTNGQVIGEHDGVWFYTIGQRHGFRTSGGRPPMYVIEKDVDKNQLVVGFGAETYQSQFQVDDCNWLISNDKFLISNKNIKVRIRHGGELIPAKLKIENSLKIGLAEPQRGVAPGQSVVLYDGDVVVGGGIIN